MNKFRLFASLCATVSFAHSFVIHFAVCSFRSRSFLFRRFFFFVFIYFHVFISSPVIFFFAFCLYTMLILFFLSVHFVRRVFTSLSIVLATKWAKGIQNQHKQKISSFISFHFMFSRGSLLLNYFTDTQKKKKIKTNSRLLSSFFYFHRRCKQKKKAAKICNRTRLATAHQQQWQIEWEMIFGMTNKKKSNATNNNRRKRWTIK